MLKVNIIWKMFMKYCYVVFRFQCQFFKNKLNFVKYNSNSVFFFIQEMYLLKNVFSALYYVHIFIKKYVILIYKKPGNFKQMKIVIDTILFLQKKDLL